MRNQFLTLVIPGLVRFLTTLAEGLLIAICRLKTPRKVNLRYGKPRWTRDAYSDFRECQEIKQTQSNPTLGNHQSVEDVSFICYAKEMTSNHENVPSRRGGLSQSREEALFSFSHLRGWQTFAQSLSHSAPLFMTDLPPPSCCNLGFGLTKKCQ